MAELEARPCSLTSVLAARITRLPRARRQVAGRPFAGRIHEDRPDKTGNCSQSEEPSDDLCTVLHFAVDAFDWYFLPISYRHQIALEIVTFANTPSDP